jgi:hypothetical protein
MNIYITFLDYIALTLYAICLSGALGGVWIFWRSPGKLRLWGIALLAECVGAALLLTLMSGKYWSAEGKGVIDVGIRALAQVIASAFIPFGSGIAIVLVIGHLSLRLIESRYRVAGFLLPILLMPVIFTTSIIQLMKLTERNQPVSPDPAQAIQLPQHFNITVFKKGPVNIPTSLTFGPDNNLYVANYNGDIWAFSMTDDSSWRFATGFLNPVGLAWHENGLYVASHGKVSVLHDNNGDNIADKTVDLITGLPARLYPWHANNGVVFGPDGRMYFAVGSTTDAASETRQYAATILSAEPDGGDLQIVASGVRNPYRVAFNSGGDLFAIDNGPDSIAATPGDELNYIVDGGDYGFPEFFGLAPPASGTLSPVAVLPPHAGASGLVFYQSDQFPPEFSDNAFLTLWHLGQIYRIQLTKDANGDYASQVSIFVSGMLNPVDLAIGPDGSLYAADYGASIIYRITYTGDN